MRLGFSTNAEVERIGDKATVFLTFVEETISPPISVRVAFSDDVDSDVLEHVIECFPKLFKQYIADVERQLNDAEQVGDEFGWWHGRS